MNPAGANAGGVSWYSPGPSARDEHRRSPWRHRRRGRPGPRCATAFPKRMPRSTRWPDPIWPARTGRTPQSPAAGWAAAHRARCAPRPPPRHPRKRCAGHAGRSAAVAASKDPVHRVVDGDLGDRQRAGGMNRSGLGAGRDQNLCSSWFHWSTWSGVSETWQARTAPRRGRELRPLATAAVAKLAMSVATVANRAKRLITKVSDRSGEGGSMTTQCSTI